MPVDLSDLVLRKGLEQAGIDACGVVKALVDPGQAGQPARFIAHEIDEQVVLDQIPLMVERKGNPEFLVLVLLADGQARLELDPQGIVTV